ncbi:unnamed protein product [Ectocarpus sp. 13 AM-2016]
MVHPVAACRGGETVSSRQSLTCYCFIPNQQCEYNDLSRNTYSLEEQNERQNSSKTRQWRDSFQYSPLLGVGCIHRPFHQKQSHSREPPELRHRIVGCTKDTGNNAPAA